MTIKALRGALNQSRRKKLLDTLAYTARQSHKTDIDILLFTAPPTAPRNDNDTIILAVKGQILTTSERTPEPTLDIIVATPSTDSTAERVLVDSLPLADVAIFLQIPAAAPAPPPQKDNGKAIIYKYGRPPKYTAATAGEIAERLERGESIRTIAINMQMSTATVQKIKKSLPETYNYR